MLLLLFKRQSKNRAFFQNYRTFTLIKDPRANPWANPRADLRARQRSENPTPGATKMCESSGGRPGGWSGLDLTDTLSGNQGCTFWCEYGISQCFFQDFTDCLVILFFLDCGLIIRGPTAARARAGYSVQFEFVWQASCRRPQTVPACYDSTKNSQGGGETSNKK